MQIKQVFSHYERQDRLMDRFKHCPSCGSQLILAQSDHQVRPLCPACGFVQYRNPAPTVSVLVVDGDQVLLGKRSGSPGKGTWSLPSGYIEYDDDFLTAAIREAKEETGLDIEIGSIINVVSSFVSPRFHFLGVYVLARVIGGELAVGDDLEDIRWVPVAGPLPEMGFEEDVSIIQLYAKGFEGLAVDSDYAKLKSRKPGDRA